MSSSNSFVSLTAILLVASGIAAAVSGYSYMQNSKADRYFMTESSELKAAALQAIYISERAAVDASYTVEMSGYESDVERIISRLRGGDPSQGIQGLQEPFISTLRNFEEAWSQVTPSIGKIVSSKSKTEVFTRNAQDTVRSAEATLSQAESAFEAVSSNAKVTVSAKKQIEGALEDLREGVALISRVGALNTDVLRSAESAISQYLGAMTAVGNSLPRDNSILEPLLKSYRGAQTTQRSLIRTIDSASNATENLPHAKTIWQQRDRVTLALIALQASMKAMPDAHLAGPLVVAGSGLLMILLALVSFFMILRTSASREEIAETRGNSIQTSQRDRSAQLQLLLTELNRVGQGDLTTEITQDKESTKEIARELNTVFGNIKSVLDEANITIVGLAAASEQTLLTAKNVDRNRQEQFRAIEHISDLISNMLAFIGVIEQLTSKTQRVTVEVATKVRSGTDSVSDVHEGIILLNQHNTGIQHQSKNLIESFQHLERIAEVVKTVAVKSEYVAWNAYLVADQIDDTDVSRRITKSAEAMTSLSRESNTAVAEISQLLRTMNEAARDTQTVVDSSQREIESLLNRSSVAQESLSSINEMTGHLSKNVDDVTSRTQELKEQSGEVAETMTSIHHYATENSAASEQTAAAISNVNRQAQELQRGITKLTSAP